MKCSPSLPWRRVFVIMLVIGLFALPVSVSALEGVVRDSGGDGIADITVTAHLPGNIRHETVTDSSGAFQFPNATVDGETVMQLDGPEGTGRIVIAEETAEEPLELEYPVISELILLHDNDQHFDFNFVEAIQAEIERIRDEHTNVFHINAGDVFTRHSDRWGEPEEVSWYADKAFYMIDTMNELGYDALAVGNHELHHHEHYTREALERAEFPLLCANMTITTDRLPQFDPYTVFETREGYTIAVLGLSVGNFEGVSPTDPIETAQDYTHLAEEHDLFVAATHIGHGTDRELAEAVPELDVIIGGHSHTLLEKAEMVNGVLVAQAGGGGHEPDPEKPMYLGKITLTLSNGSPIEKSGFVREFTEEDAEKPQELAFDGLHTAGQADNELVPFKVEAVDGDGRRDPSYSGAITVAIADGPGELSGTLTRQAVDGVAEFDDLAVSEPGAYQFEATAPDLAPAVSEELQAVALEEILVPRYMQAGPPHPNKDRVPYAFRLRITGLNPNATYRYANRIATVDEPPKQDGAGNNIFVFPDEFRRNTDTPAFDDDPATLSSFETETDGAHEGWFITEPTGNDRFEQEELHLRLLLNDGAGGDESLFF